MDAKALAKSKRAHTLHHTKKPRPSLKPKAVPVGAANSNKPLGNGITTKEKTSRSQLPSNWDRYKEEFDFDSGQLLDAREHQVSDVVLPKSKGADYRHLIAEARSTSYSDSFHSVEDILAGDFMDGLGYMLSAMGESLFSLAGDDNFVVDDGKSVNYEPSFLSLNLDALAEQLEKVDISERLYLEADLIPPEMRAEGSRVNDARELDHVQKAEEIPSKDVSENFKCTGHNTRAKLSGSTPEPMLTTLDRGLNLSNKVEDDLNYHVGISAEVSKEKRSPAFEATTAEAELDMLLHSFSGAANLLDSSNTILDEGKGKKSHTPSKTISATANLDSFLDDLLDKTSNHHVFSQPEDINSGNSSSTISKSKVLDDFDSWLDTI